MKFSALGLSEAVMKGISEARFTDCTPVQELVLPYSLANKDVMVQSKTGSGKTAVYIITILEKYMRAYLSKTALPAALVVAPTRELALQIEEDAELLSKYVPGFRTGCFYGGVGYGAQNEELKEGLSLYVGTPGRLIDFASSNKIDFRMFTTVVLDEADRMFDMGFYHDVDRMFSMMLPPQERQTMILSATLTVKVRNIAWSYMNEPLELESQPEEITVDKIKQELFHVTKDEEFSLLLQLLHKLQPKSTLIFTNTKDRAVEVSQRLKLNGYKSAYLMGDMKQSERLKALDKLKEGKLEILVATDIAARGLQIDDLELVVNYDLPEDYENYVHRIGRTARAGKEGRAISLASEEYIYSLEAIENYIQMKIPVCWSDEYGLEEVGDKSLDYVKSIRRRAKERNGRKDEGRNRRGERGRKPASSSRTDSGRKPARQKEKKLSDSDYENLSKMSFEERLAFYKNEFSSKPSPSDGKKTQKPAGKTAGKKVQKNTHSGVKAQNAKSGSARVKAPVASITSAPQHISTKPEKKSFWAKVVSIFKGE